jgi:vacuolar-type H+-ATPase subunit H
MPNHIMAEDVAKKRVEKAQSWAEWIAENILGGLFKIAGRILKKKRKQIEGEEEESLNY